MNIIRFAHEYHSLCSCASFALLMCVIRFAHVYRSLYSCVLFALLMHIIRFAHACCSLCSRLFLEPSFYSIFRWKRKGLPPYRSVNQSWATCSGSKALPRCARTVLFYFSPRSSASGWTRLKIKKHLFYRTSAFDQSAHDWIRTSTPNGTTPSRWHVYQFHHVGM